MFGHLSSISSLPPSRPSPSLLEDEVFTPPLHTTSQVWLVQ